MDDLDLINSVGQVEVMVNSKFKVPLTLLGANCLSAPAKVCSGCKTVLPVSFSNVTLLEILLMF